MDKNTLQKAFFGSRVVVTGGTGLIGRQVVDLLVSYGAEVSVLTMDHLMLNPQVNYIRMDIRDYRDSIIFLGSSLPDYVFHLAGIKASPKASLDKAATHVSQMLLLNSSFLRACQDIDVKNLVYTSSVGVYPKEVATQTEAISENQYNMISAPMDPAGWAKRMGEYVIGLHNQEKGRTWKIARLTNTFGPGDNFDPQNAMFIGSLISRVAKKEEISLFTNGHEVRDFFYSKDAARGLIDLAVSDVHFPINLGGGEGFTVRDVVTELQRVTPFEVQWSKGEATYPYRVLDTSVAKKHLGFEPEYSLWNALHETYHWYLEYGEKEATQRKNYFTE